ncbi:MAG: hypothetical protein KBS72_01025 [Bacteroidales bacterium]|nr:hypothetical protein [Candidatus Cacconaster scatequi]
MIEIQDCDFGYGYWVKSSMKKHQIFVCRFTLLFDENMRLVHAEGLLAGFKLSENEHFSFDSAEFSREFFTLNEGQKQQKQ